MPATTEFLLEEIKRTEDVLSEAKAIGDRASIESCELALKTLRKTLNKANEALNEGASKILKG